MDTELERPRWRFTGSYRLHQRLQIGVEYNPLVQEIGPIVTAFLFTETESSPAVFLGTSSDRIGSPEGTQSYYATMSKYIPAIRTSGYVSLNYSEWDEGMNLPFGAAFEIGNGVAARYMYDGNQSHLLLDVSRSYVGVSLMWVWLETAGIALYGGF